MYSKSILQKSSESINTGIALLDEISELECGETYKVDYVTENLGDFTEDVEFMGALEDFSWTATKTDLASGATTTTGSKTFTIDSETFNNGIDIATQFKNLFF